MGRLSRYCFAATVVSALSPLAWRHAEGSASAAATEFVGIKLGDFQSHYRAQQQSMWCWASCAEMVLSYESINLPQEAIVNAIKGFGVPGFTPNQGGNPVEMIRSTNHFIKTQDGDTAVVSGQFVAGAPLPNVIYNHLKRKKPFILTYQSGPWMGHAVVVHGMDIHVDEDRAGQEIEPVVLHVADPFCYSQAYDRFGRPILTKDDSLRFRKYAWRPTEGADPFPGAISGAILVEATLR
ncbi:MAG: C39 family peptidase [Planctomycetes bacterium]|nr:C39 family peptidase [Planctomycetota bacterium]